MIKLATTDTDTERLLKGSVLLQAESNAHKKTALKLDSAVKQLENWIGFFENDFALGDVDGNYVRMKSYLETIEIIRAEKPYMIDPYRDGIVEQVKEKLNEIKI